MNLGNTQLRKKRIRSTPGIHMKFFLITVIFCSTTQLFACQFAKTDLEKTFLIAAQEGRLKTIKECLESGVNPNVQDRATGNTALHYLFQWFCFEPKEENLKILCSLLKHPAHNVNIQNTYGYTSLHTAAQISDHRTHDKNDLMRLMQQLGINYHETFWDGKTLSGQVEVDFSSICMAVLLEKDANPSLHNYSNKLPIHKVRSAGAFKLLLEKMGNNIDLRMLVRCATLRHNDCFGTPDYNGLLYALHANNFTSEMAKGALLKIKKKYDKELIIQQEIEATGCVPDEYVIASLLYHGRVLLYYCTIFNLLRFPEAKDEQKQCMPQLPKEMVHFIARDITKAYIEKIQEKEAKK